MPVDLQTFLNSLASSGILSEGEVTELRQSCAANKPQPDVRNLARELVKQHRLTPFQARALYHGASKGLTVGSYIILDRIGVGGMGQVFKAQHRRMKRIVALKVLPASKVKLGDSLRRFQREVEAAAKLNHPNIVTAHDANVESGVHYLVMEFVEGHDLHWVVKHRGPIPAAEAAYWVLQVAEGLEYAHQHGVVHRDIKPGNLLLDVNNIIKILDMGLARLEEPGGDDDADGPLTQMGEIIGTIDFMSPEQAEDTRQADARSDIYSLGCTLHYLLTGEFLFPADTMLKKLLAHREQPVPSLARRDKSFPAELESIYQKMVAKQPNQRYQTMTEVIDALKGCREKLGPLPASYPSRPDTPPSKSDAPEQFNLDLAPDDDLEKSSEASTQRKLMISDAEYTQRLAAPDTRRTANPLPAMPVAPEKEKTRRKPTYPIVVGCPCGALFAAEPNMAGRTTPCPSCNSSISIPATSKVELVCKCGQRYAASDKVLGRNVICTRCRALMTIPKPKPLEVACRCGQRFAAIEELAGKTVPCPVCGTPLVIPKRTM